MKYFSTVTTTNGWQSSASFFEGARHKHRKRPSVLSRPTCVSEAEVVRRQTAQQDCPVQPVQSTKAALTCSLGKTI
jgi:hypothetical protein